MSYLGVDIGTTRIKALLYETGTGKVLAEGAAATPFSPGRVPGRDAEAVARAVFTVIASTLEQGPFAGSLAGIGLTSLSEEVVLVDGYGRPAGPVIPWFDPRGSEYAAHAPRVLAGANPSFTVFKLRWLAQHRRADASRARFLTGLSGYVLARLTGTGTAGLTMDWSHASRSGFFDVSGRSWVPEALEWAGFPARSLPRLVPPGSAVGTLSAGLARAWGVPACVPVVSAGHDHFCGAFAAGVRQPGQAYLSAGTSEAHLVLCDQPPSAADPGVDVGCYVDGQSYYVHRNLLSGRLYQEWTAALDLQDDDELQSEMAALSPGSGGLRFLVSGRGEEADLVNPGSETNKAAILRTVQEGIAVAAGRMAELLADTSGRPVEEYLAAGPPTLRPLWRELRAGLSTTRFRFVGHRETTALGAALLTQRAVEGSADSPVQATEPAPLPGNVAAAYRELLRSYQSATREETSFHAAC